ncbi:hypothetical protein BG000_004582 [Podila horticola]|nr:hypothetical protein BG000_004582 [Podila horticola]
MAGSIDMAADVWQTFRQPDFRTQSLQRRQFWIDQANVGQGNMPKVAVVTGANAGLGFETAKSLVETGYLVILEAVEQIETQTGIRNMAVTMPLDLSSFKSIQAFALDFKNRGIGLDVLVNNAATMDIPFSLTEDGFEMQFGVNHLGHFLLTMELLPLLNKSLQGRVIVVSSLALYFSDGVHYDRLRANVRYCHFDCYARSKLANMLFVKALNRRLRQAKSKVTVNAVHPGVCYTAIFQNTSIMKAITLPAGKCLMRSPQEGAITLLYLA